MSYSLINSPSSGAQFVRRDEDGAMIPMDDANRDYQDYLAWVAAGNAATPAPAPSRPATIPSYDYFQRFSAPETLAIHKASLAAPPSETSLALYNYLLLAAARGEVDLRSPTVATGHALLVQAGLLSAARSAEILTP